MLSIARGSWLHLKNGIIVLFHKTHRIINKVDLWAFCFGKIFHTFSRVSCYECLGTKIQNKQASSKEQPSKKKSRQ